MAIKYSFLFSPLVVFLIVTNLSLICRGQRLHYPPNKSDNGQRASPFYAPPFALDAALSSPNSRVFIAPPANPQHEKHFRDSIPQPSVIIIVQNGTAGLSSAQNVKEVEKNSPPQPTVDDTARQKLIYIRTAHNNNHKRRQPTLFTHRKQHTSRRRLNAFLNNEDPRNNNNFIPQFSPTNFLPSSLMMSPFQQPSPQQQPQQNSGDPIKPLDANEPFMMSPSVQTDGEQPDEILDAPQQRHRPPPHMLNSRLGVPPNMMLDDERPNNGPFGRSLPPMMPFGGEEGEVPPQQFMNPTNFQSHEPNLDGRLGFGRRPANRNIFSSLASAVDIPGGGGGGGGGNGFPAPMGALEIADSFEPGATFGNGNRGDFGGIPGGNNMDFFMNRAMSEMDRSNNAVDTIITANRMPTLRNGLPVNSSESVTNVDPAHSLVTSDTVYRDPSSGGVGYFSEFKLLPNGRLNSGGSGNDLPLTGALRNNLKAEDGNTLGRRSGVMQDELPIHYPNDNQQSPMWLPPPPFLFGQGAASPSKSLEELADKVLAAKKIRPLTSKATKRVNRRKKAAIEKLYYP